jgi:hypothetical protein
VIQERFDRDFSIDMDEELGFLVSQSHDEAAQVVGHGMRQDEIRDPHGCRWRGGRRRVMTQSVAQVVAAGSTRPVDATGAPGRV